MKTKFLDAIFAVVALTIVALPARAQFSADYQTNTINTATNWMDKYVVGSNTCFDVLQVVNGGILTNSFGYIGHAAGGSNNLAIVDGTGGSASWINSTNLYIGLSGKNNRLLIVGGGTVVSQGTPNNSVGAGTIGSGGGAHSNSVTVAGANSVWTNNGVLYVGGSGDMNLLTITNGGKVISNGGVGTGNVTAIGDQSGSASNLVVVAGSGSLWTNNGTLLIGRSGVFNGLVISNGGAVINGDAVIGRLANSNFVMVTDGGTWTNTSSLTLSTANSFNQLVVSNGGTVSSVSDSLIGGNAGANSNSVTLTGSGTVWTNGGQVKVGNSGAFSQMMVADGALALNASMILGVNSSSISNRLTVSGSGTVVSNGFITVGSGGSFNELLISDGARIINSASSTIGSGGGSTNNLAVVAGAHTLWLNASSTFNLGNGSLRSRLIVTNGGTLVTLGNFYVANSASSVSNSLLVSGTDSVWTNAGMNFGYNGAYNQLTVSNGGVVASTAAATLGNFAGSTGNVAVVTGNGSLWTNSFNIVVGNSAFSNALFISEGGRVSASSLSVGSSAGSNRVEIASQGVLEVGGSGLTVGSAAGNTISNDGGIYQFSSGTPSITPNGYGRISLTGGTISFRGVSNANVWGSLGSNELGGILYAGNNLFRLDSASNTHAASPQDYTFASGVSPSNYVGLEMVNGSTAWRSAQLNVGTGGSLLVSNTAATMGGVLTNSGVLRVVNSAVTWLSNAVVSAGSYTFAGATNTFSEGLSIASGALFGGSGRVASDATVTNAGTLAPGNSPGTMSFSSNLTLLDSSTLVLEIAGTNAADYDLLVVEGALALAGTLTVTNLGVTLAAGNTFNLFDFGSWSGAFSLTNLPALTGGLNWDFSQFNSQGILSISAIPEPSPVVAIGAGLALLAFLRRRKAVMRR
ncbi:MAG: PEP-CTERM sorting domain-containing protein [Verrucomicrobiae bacterium]|nr:PEP-CTERM sorting domain-containing protein [Verrucomicrobiae bacterium]